MGFEGLSQVKMLFTGQKPKRKIAIRLMWIGS